MESPAISSVFWVNILERDGWIVVNVNDRPLGIIVSITEAGREFLKIVGYHMGETMFVGERRNILSIKVERIQESQQKKILPLIHSALPAELRGLPLTFL
jgi:DNA-binding PadR family transcriptional regulator